MKHPNRGVCVCAWWAGGGGVHMEMTAMLISRGTNQEMGSGRNSNIREEIYNAISTSIYQSS